MNITTTTEGSKITLELEGWLDTSTAPELKAAIDSLDKSCTSLVIDFSNLKYISSAGLRQLVAAHRKMSGAMTLVNLSPEIRDILGMAGFDKLFNIEER